MRILFDNNVPGPLRRYLSEHSVRTAEQMKWEKPKNGDLLMAGEAAGFDVMISADQNIRYQQNLTKRNISLVVLGANLWPLVRNDLPETLAAVRASRTKSYAFIPVKLPPKHEYKRP